MTSRTGRRAFTLVELLVTIAIIAVLASLLLVAIQTVQATARKTQAAKEVNEISSAIKTYFMEHKKYIPDTADWGAGNGFDERVGGDPAERDIDPRSIHKYLASPQSKRIRSEKTVQMDIVEDRLAQVEVDTDGEEYGIYVDPWDMPFHVDCMHMYYDADSKRWKAKGYPYYSGGNQSRSAITDDEERRFTKKFKVVSYGPDSISAPYPFDDEGTTLIDKEKTIDDLRSW